MEYGRFIENGKAYEIVTPLTPGAWNNVLYNGEYYLEVSQTLQGAGYAVKDYVRSNVFNEYRYFYVKDKQSGEVWCPNYVPLANKQDQYRCVHDIWSSRIRSLNQGIESVIRVSVPPTGSREIWKITLRNTGVDKREISLYSVFGIYDHGVMGGECEYDEGMRAIVKYAVPYHVFYEDREKILGDKAYIYTLSDRTPSSCEMSKYRFFGNQGVCGIPEGVKEGRLSGVKGEAEEFCSAFGFDFVLNPGEETTVCLEAGAVASKEEISQKSKTFSHSYVEQLEDETRADWEEKLDGFYLQTPDPNLNAFGNYWLKKQIIQLTTQNRGGSYCPVRNQLQDALGYAMLCPERAKKYIFDVVKLQNRDGFIQQWYDTTGAPPRGLCLLKHTDGPVWLAICAEALVRHSGDADLLQASIPYADGGEGSLLEHMTVALKYLAGQLGERGLCLMGDGDWNDPINGVGREGKGESVWLSEAFVYAVDRILPYLTKFDPLSESELSQAANRMKEAINTHAWCGDRYAVAIHDNGTLMGDQKDRLFLNTQSWAILSKVADEKKCELIMQTVKDQLETPFGPLLLYPPFTAWDERWGRVSVKKAGTTENGSVYCHASMFYAYAQAMLGDGDGLYETIRRTLPTNPENPPSKNLQNPIYLANYYYGLRESENFGRSSRHYGTGTVAWMLMLLIEELLGIKASVDGLKVEPCLPGEWKEVTCTKKYRGKTYHIHISRGTKEANPYEVQITMA